MSKSYEYYSQTFSQREGRSPLPEPMRLEHLAALSEMKFGSVLIKRY